MRDIRQAIKKNGGYGVYLSGTENDGATTAGKSTKLTIINSTAHAMTADHTIVAVSNAKNQSVTGSFTTNIATVLKEYSRAFKQYNNGASPKEIAYGNVSYYANAKEDINCTEFEYGKCYWE